MEPPSCFIVATMPDGAHTYSITQPDGGPIRTKIKVDSTAEVPEIGKFLTATKPKITHMEDAFPGVPLEEQSGKVKWFAPIKLAAGAKLESVKVAGKVVMQLCDDNGCVMPKDYKFTAAYDPDAKPEKEPAAAKEDVKKPAAPAANPSTLSPPATKPSAPTSFLPPSGAGMHSLLSPRSQAQLGTGDRVPKIDAGFTAGLRRLGRNYSCPGHCRRVSTSIRSRSVGSCQNATMMWNDSPASVPAQRERCSCAV